MPAFQRGVASQPRDAAQRAARAAVPAPPMLALQRSLGNTAVSHLVGVQRRMQVEERAEELDEHEHGAGCGHDQPVQSESVRKVIASKGQEVDPAIRFKAEQGLGGHSLADVEMHTGEAARRSAAELGARAYTTGRHIVVGEGGNDEHTILHELRHAWQQQQGAVAGKNNGGGISLSNANDVHEKDAESWATSMRNAPAQPRTAESAPAGEGAHEAPAAPAAMPSVQRMPRIVTVSPRGADDDSDFEDTHSRNPRYESNGVTYITRDSRSNRPRTRNPDQNTLMGGSAGDAVARSGGPRRSDFSWLHREAAWASGDPVGGTPQRRSNMLAGTQSTNMHHLRYENPARMDGVDMMGVPITQMGSNGYIGPNQYREAEYSVRSPYDPLSRRFSTRLDPYDSRPVSARERAGEVPSTRRIREDARREFAHMTMDALPESEWPPEYRRARRSRRDDDDERDRSASPRVIMVAPRGSRR